MCGTISNVENCSTPASSTANASNAADAPTPIRNEDNQAFTKMASYVLMAASYGVFQ